MMKPVKGLPELLSRLAGMPKKRIAVAHGQDPYTIESVFRAVKEGIAEVIMFGDQKAIKQICEEKQLDPAAFEIHESVDPLHSCRLAVKAVRSGEADILMKGFVGTDKFLKSVLDKEEGIHLPGAVMSYTGILDIPAYNKLLLISDPAVIPFPDLNQKASMISYSVQMAHKLGIETPRVSLLSCTEKVNPGIPNTMIDAALCKMADRGHFPGCIIDGPLDLFLSCDPTSGAVKEVKTAIGGEADILIFPSLEAANIFYKGLMVFAGAELAGLVQGTGKPVIVMSRSESPASKFYCIALSCFIAGTSN